MRVASILLASLVAASALVAGVLSAVPARAQDDGPSLEERRAIVQSLPADEKARLRAALDRFRSLPRDQQEALRKKARAVGPERLGGLAGRDVGALRRRHEVLRTEIDRVMEFLGPERLAAMTPEERDYFRSEAARGFQRHVRRRLLEHSAKRPDTDFEKAPPEERRAAFESALAHLEEQELLRLPDERAAEIRAMPPKERARVRARILADWRMGETLVFARQFDAFRVQKWATLSAEEREKELSRWRTRSRWFQARKVLHDELGLRPASLERLAQLPPMSWSRVLYEVRVTETLPVEERRERIERLVDELYGRAALEGAPVPPLAPRGRGSQRHRAPRTPSSPPGGEAPPAERAPR